MKFVIFGKIKDFVCYTVLGEYEDFNNFVITFLNLIYYNVILIYEHLNNVSLISIYKCNYKTF